MIVVTISIWNNLTPIKWLDFLLIVLLVLSLIVSLQSIRIEKKIIGPVLLILLDALTGYLFFIATIIHSPLYW